MAEYSAQITVNGPVQLDRVAGTPVVDTHIHLWDRGRHGYPWLDRWTQFGDLVDAALLTCTAVGLAGAVFIEAAVRPEDARAELAWLADQAALCPFPVRIVAQQLPASPSWWTDAPGGQLVAGVRRVMHLAEPGTIAAAEFVDEARGAGEAGVSVDLTVRHEQLDEVEFLVQRTPGTRFVLDHLGKPAPQDGGFAEWASAVARVAAHTNVVCKLSSIAVQPGNPPFHPEQAVDYVAHALAEFGADRCAYGTDWPVLTHATSFGTWLDVVCAALDGATTSEREAVFAGTARQTYGFITRTEGTS
ncbi:amidohydrolase family protein [Streptomyces violaceus]|uniref:Amidohydrolase family protein n=1 Tax=Streptomyces violaceus TaxID=1936 RepID=A0ABZ1P2K1_STRVL|nr:amidohydrolase family protein [Streptomyces violaceus]